MRFLTVTLFITCLCTSYLISQGLCFDSKLNSSEQGLSILSGIHSYQHPQLPLDRSSLDSKYKTIQLKDLLIL